MKRSHSFLALCLALGFFFPNFACAANDTAPPNSSDMNTDSSFGNPEDSSSNDSGSSGDNSGDNSTDKPPSDDSSSSPNTSTTPDTSTPPNNSTQPNTPPSSSKPENTTPTPSQNAQYILCTGDNVNLRESAGTNYAVLGQAEKGTMYAVIGETGNWYKTYYRNKVAYIHAKYANVFTLKKSKESRVEKVVEEAYKLLGVPYVYGAVRLHDGNGNFLKGFSTQKFDCSSLVQYAFYQGAKTLLHTTTRTQVKQGKYVAKADLQRGDCLFFTNEDRRYNVGIERVGHVAIYLGDNYILHTSSDYARIEQINAKRWSFYLEARRFL